MKKFTLQQIYNFCKGEYFTDDETIWQPFEDYDEEQVLEFVMGSFLNLCDFLEIKHSQSDVLKLKL
jgi:hypothetical protein